MNMEAVEPWNHPQFWKSEDECIVCGCSRQAENCLCGACDFGCRYDSELVRAMNMEAVEH